ncbi:MAG: hypothetical protein LBN95_06340, partial [Prevotellaceae bacterium]|nr:hypothetical protein [Prevotellaceae bacterium]
MPENNLTLLEISKNFRTFYQKKYDELAEKIETPEYFADKVQKNYIYKGAAIAKNARKLLKTHNNFAEIIN